MNRLDGRLRRRMRGLRVQPAHFARFSPTRPIWTANPACHCGGGRNGHQRMHPKIGRGARQVCPAPAGGEPPCPALCHRLIHLQARSSAVFRITENVDPTFFWPVNQLGLGQRVEREFYNSAAQTGFLGQIRPRRVTTESARGWISPDKMDSVSAVVWRLV